MTRRKRDQRGGGLSSEASPTELKKVEMSEEDVEISSLKDLIKNLTETMESNFGKLHEELSAIRQEMKHEIDSVKENVKSVEKSVEELWATVEDLKEETKALKDTKKAQEQEVEGLRSLLMKTKAELKEEREKIIELEDYTRRENLKFHNIPEANDEGVTQSSKQVILDILEKELQMDTTDIRFQAVHRIGRRKEKRNRPIIARFLCREDRDRVFSRKQALKESRRYRDAYITADYAKAIQEERRKLIRAMFKAKERGLQAKVVGRFLHIGEQKYNVTNIPEDFKDN